MPDAAIQIEHSSAIAIAKTTKQAVAKQLLQLSGAIGDLYHPIQGSTNRPSQII